MRTRTVLNGFMGLAAIMLVGCNSDDPVPQPEISNVILSGGVAKGVINRGNVVAEELDDNGAVIAKVGSAVTGIDGGYRLTVDRTYSGGPIRVTVSADANTEMKCDVPAGCGERADDITDSDNVIDFGEWYKPGNLTMVALVAEAKANDSLVANVTPYTHLAASRAMEAESLDAAGIYNANSEVSNLLGGVDILGTDIVDVTDAYLLRGGSAMEIVYAAFSSAVATLADTSRGSPDINGVLELLSSSFRGGMIIADDESVDDSVISLQEIVDGANSVLGKVGAVGISDTSGKIANVQASIDEAVAAGGNIDPRPSPITGASALARVKSFVRDMRTWGIVIEEETRAERSAFIQQVGMAAMAAGASHEFLTGPAFAGVLDAIKQSFGSIVVNGSLSDYTVGLPEGPQFSAGTITSVGGIISITGAMINGVTVDIAMQLPAHGVTATSFTLGIVSASLRSAATDVELTSGTITLNTAAPYTVNWMPDALSTDLVPPISGGSVDLGMVLTQKLDAMGAPIAAVTFAGDLAATLSGPVEDGYSGSIWATSNSVVMSGSISDTTGNSLDANLVANTTGIGGGVGGFLPFDPFSTGSMGLTFSLQLAGLPEASVNISSSRTGFYESGTMTVAINYGLRQILMDSSYSGMSNFATINATGSITITNQDGVSMVLENDFKISPGSIALNGQMYATVVHLNNGLTKITYTDGTFDIL
ncbi:MAG TPA: hypothetical protein ENK04_00960 [Gammaproteobacteria bacterium]|nr:hypothetical protein [Gammaproteobacteria bacterium]